MTSSRPRREEEIRQRLEQLKHEVYVAKREGQLLRFELRTELMRERAKQALADGKISEADVEKVKSAHARLREKVGALKSGGTSSREARTEATEAWNDLRIALGEAREKAGMAKRPAAV